jgi:flavin reductase (DIM6/NTAB) family NADH-FMN oxidoreductase RutF
MDHNADRGRRELRPGAQPGDAYRLLTSLVVPRPIAWISTQDTEGVGNLAPHSFFSVASAEPPLISFASIGRKDTLRNVLATREFVVNLASEPAIDQVNASSASFPADVDEAEEVGVAMVPSELVGPPRVAASPACLECTLYEVVDLPHGALVLGRVELISVEESCFVEDRPAIDRLRPLARLGGSEWARRFEVVRLRRPR